MNDGQDGQQHLNSWKEVAAFLDVSERTAQNWERMQGLPVRRLSGPKGRIVAVPAELEDWKKNAARKQSDNGNTGQATPAFLRKYAVLLIALGLVLTGVLAWLLFAYVRTGPPAGYIADYRTLIATDKAGKVVWKRVMKYPFFAQRYAVDPNQREAAWFGDLDGDSRTEMLFLYDSARRSEVGTRLICYSDEGAEKWSFTSDRTVSDLEKTYGPPFVSANLLVADLNRDGIKEILVTSHHLSDHPNQFVVLDPHGNVTGEYWHSGFLETIDTMDLDQDGIDEILLADVNNGYGRPTLVVLDPRDVAGASTQPPGDTHQLQGFELGHEKAVVLFPRSCVNLAKGNRSTVSRLAVTGGRITVEIVEDREDRACVLSYTLGRDLNPLDLTPSDRFEAVHHQLEQDGTLDHPLTAQEIDRLRTGVTVIRYAPLVPGNRGPEPEARGRDSR